MRHGHDRGSRARKAITAAVDNGADAVGVAQRLVSHPDGFAHPQVGVVVQADSPAHQHRRGVAATGAGIGVQGVPCRAQHACQGRRVDIGKRGMPLAIGLRKGIGGNIGSRGGRAGGETQLRHGIGWIHHRPAIALRGKIGEAVLRDNHNHSANGVSRHHGTACRQHLHTVDLDHLAAHGHGVTLAQREQPVAHSYCTHCRGHARHLQRLFALAHVTRQPGHAAGGRLAIGERHHGPWFNTGHLHFLLVFHGFWY